MVYSPVFVVK